jgi:hypothetical protein
MIIDPVFSVSLQLKDPIVEPFGLREELKFTCTHKLQIRTWQQAPPRLFKSHPKILARRTGPVSFATRLRSESKVKIRIVFSLVRDRMSLRPRT